MQTETLIYGPKSITETNIPFDELESLVIEKGDTNAYEWIALVYIDSLLPYALIMADEYDYPQAYFDVYLSLLKSTEDPEKAFTLDSCDEKTRKMAIRYLKIAVEKEDCQAISELGQLYYEGKFLPKDTVFGKMLIMKSDSLYEFWQ